MLSLAFSSLAMMYQGMDFFVFILFGIHWTFKTCILMFSIKFGRFWPLFHKIWISAISSYSSLSGILITCMLILLILPPSVSEALLILFFFFLSFWLFFIGLFYWFFLLSSQICCLSHLQDFSFLLYFFTLKFPFGSFLFSFFRLKFPLHWVIVIIFFFNSLNYNLLYLNLFLTAALKPLSVKSNIWVCSESIFIDFIFSEYQSHFPFS